ncbi:MAG TPA: helix-turn-helix transcriptional regulator, partial [Vicinamibacterales bacterium]|nr:helix-turn-helix transcriptional regulator [Vicinamibacterales bacterium]
LDVRDGDDPVEVRVTTPTPFGAEYLVSLMALHLRQETNGQFVIQHAMFRHELDDKVAMSRAVGCPIQTGAPWDGAQIARVNWDLPLRRRDPVLRQVLQRHADEVLARLPSRRGIALEVQRALSSPAALADARVDTLARRLGMSSRSLQRRLSAEGVSFQSLLDEARKEAAARYVAESTLSLAEVAYLIGYSEPAPFHRAFKRWYGATPDQFRKRG